MKIVFSHYRGQLLISIEFEVSLSLNVQTEWASKQLDPEI